MIESEDKKVKVSICIPVYKNPKGLKKLLESIAVQDFKDFEVIVSDDVDGADRVSDSDDISGAGSSYINSDIALCKDIALNFQGSMDLKYIKHRSTGRPGDNWNSSIENASGKYIKMMFHDDWFTGPDSLGKYVKLLDSSDAPFAFSGSMQVSSDWRYARHIKDKDLQIISEAIRNLYIGNTIGAPSATIFRNKGIEFDRNLRWLIDMDFYLRQMDADAALDTQGSDDKPLFSNTDEPLVSIGISDSQLTNYCRKHPWLVRREYLYVGKKYGFLSNPEYNNYFWSQIKNPH